MTRSGASAAHLGRRAGFARCSSDPADALDPERVQAVVIATRHDSHAELAARALEAGLAVFVEKPLAVDQAGLERVTAALRANPGILLVGFNRRFAAPTRALLEALPTRTGPGLVQMRVAAGALPPDHWALDRTEGGGRIVGEVCHFLDLASFLLGQQPAGVYARASDPDGPSPSANVSILVDYPDHSTAVIQYHAVGGRRMPKELVEAAWDGASARIDDFRSLEVWSSGRGRSRRVAPPGQRPPPGAGRLRRLGAGRTAGLEGRRRAGHHRGDPRRAPLARHRPAGRAGQRVARTNRCQPQRRASRSLSRSGSSRSRAGKVRRFR